MPKAQNIRVGISIGDLNGIGCEIVLKTFSHRSMTELCTPVVFASSGTLDFVNKALGLYVIYHGIDDPARAVPGKLNVCNVWEETPDIDFGKESTGAGGYALRSLQAAVEALKAESVDVLVTAPIHKKTIQSKSFDFPGHTDYLAKELRGDSLMFMLSENLRVGLLTDHIPLENVTEHITIEHIQKKVDVIHRSLIRDFGITRPRIALLGIDPHTGDEGVIGDADNKKTRPAVERVRKSGKFVFGPYAADSFFGSGAYKNFDAILAAYHDQGLTPFKTLSFGKGVNYTAGLSRVRTSPDHGTAFDIAGKNQADPTSFREAVYVALDIYKNRKTQAPSTK